MKNSYRRLINQFQLSTANLRHRLFHTGKTRKAWKFMQKKKVKYFLFFLPLKTVFARGPMNMKKIRTPVNRRYLRGSCGIFHYKKIIFSITKIYFRMQVFQIFSYVPCFLPLKITIAWSHLMNIKLIVRKSVNSGTQL